jgi:hypothetical protein
VHVVAHVVGLQGAPQLLDDVVRGRNLVEGEGFCGVAQALQVVEQAENGAVVKPKALPHAVAALDDAVEGTHPGLVAMYEFAVDVDDEIFVSGVGGLSH